MKIKDGAEIEDHHEYHEPDGIMGFIKDLNQNAEVTPRTGLSAKESLMELQVECATFQFTNEFRENVLGFCNNIYNAEGGTHLTGFKTAFTSSDEYLRQRDWRSER